MRSPNRPPQAPARCTSLYIKYKKKKLLRDYNVEKIRQLGRVWEIGGTKESGREEAIEYNYF
jgi:hypothetical protein